MEAGVEPAGEARPPLGPVVKIDEGRIREHLDEVVRSTVEETLNALLDAEADQLCGAGRRRSNVNREFGRTHTFSVMTAEGIPHPPLIHTRISPPVWPASLKGTNITGFPLGDLMAEHV